MVTKDTKLMAEDLVHKAFAGRIDKVGLPYVDHSIRVGRAAASFATSDEDYEYLATLGFLHDVLEDTTITAEELTRMGFDVGLVNRIKILSHKTVLGHRESYDVFIDRCIETRETTIVKFCDVMDNLSRPKHRAFKYQQKLKAVQTLAARMQDIIGG